MIAVYRVAYRQGRYALSAYFYDRARAEEFARTHRSTVVEELRTEEDAQRLAGKPPRPKR